MGARARGCMCASSACSRSSPLFRRSWSRSLPASRWIADLDRWFSTRTRAVIENSLNVAQAYVREHADAIRGDIVAMAFDVSRAKSLFDQDRARFRQFFHAQASLRGLPAAMMFGSDLWPIEKVELGPGHDFQLPPADKLAEIGTAEPRIALAPNADYVAARDQAQRIRRHVPLCRPSAVAAGRRAAQDHSGERRRIRQHGGAPVWRAGRVRPHVHGRRADRPAFGGVDRAELSPTGWSLPFAD